MKKTRNFLRKIPAAGATMMLLSPAVAILQSCDTKLYEECDTSHIIDSWGITKSTKTFGEFDSLYYIINPIGNVSDSIYFNGNYTDAYYHSDSTRVMLRYTVTDSIIFHIERMYAVQTNPRGLTVRVKSDTDTVVRDCRLNIRRNDNNDLIFSCGPDSLFKQLLLAGGRISFTATNDSTSSEPSGSQNYEFYLDATGFRQAWTMADSLNNPSKYRKADPLTVDSIIKVKTPRSKKHK